MNQIGARQRQAVLVATTDGGIAGRTVLMSDSFARRCDAELVDLGVFALRGVEAAQRVWTVAEG